MPEMKLINYVLTGPSLSKIYTQAEMATALGITETRLVGVLASGIGLSYHAHPDATGDGYWFKEKSYQENIKVWACHRGGGHQMRPNSKYNYLPGGAETCSVCGHTKFN